MSWFWSSSNTQSNSNPPDTVTKDIYSDLDLDPSVKAFARGSPNERPSRAPEPQDGQYSEPAQNGTEPNIRDEMEALVEIVKSRKNKINAGAIFNCALAEFELSECFTNGSWWDKSKLCESQKGAFWDCLEGNKKALRILGYEEPGNSPVQNQKILETADDLVHEPLGLSRQY